MSPISPKPVSPESQTLDHGADANPAEAAAEPGTYSQLYASHVRPWLGHLLQALRLDLSYTRGDGNRLYYQARDQVAGGGEHSVIDFLGGYGANFFGHWHPVLKQRLLDLVTAQVPIQAQGSVRARAAELAAALSRRVGQPGRDYVVTFTNSGAEAVEAALKHAKLAYGQRRDRFLHNFHQQAAHLQQHCHELPETWLPALLACGYDGPPQLREACEFMQAYNRRQLARRPLLLAMQRGFHGKTTAAVLLTANRDYREPFSALGFETRFLAADPEALEPVSAEARSDLFVLPAAGEALLMMPWSHILACFAEPLQGEGGIHPLPAAFLQACRELADREGFPLILDEIQCGMGRTGSFLYSQALGVEGDYYLLAKSLGGGIAKLGALLVRSDRYSYRFGKLHSSTFVEDELSAGLGLAALELLDSEDLIARAGETGAWLKAELMALQARYPAQIHAVRGEGLMLGLEFASQDDGPSPAIAMLSRQELLGYAITGYLLYEHGLRVAPTLSSPLTIRLEPAATIARADCEQLLSGLAAVCEVLAKANVYHLTRFLVGIEGLPGAVEDLSAYKPVWEPVDLSLPQVAFAGHFIEARHMPLWDRGFGLFPPETLEPYLERVHAHLGPDLYDRYTVISDTGARVQLSFLGICAASRQMNRALRQNPAPMAALLEEGLQLAANQGCTVLGLGGYNSIVTANGQSLTPDRLAITTGNALTVGMGLRAIHQAAEAKGIDLAESCFAALGANGNIASVYTELMADEVPRLLLLGRPGRDPALMKLAGRIYRQALQTIATALAANQTSELAGVARSLYHSPAFHRLSRSGELETKAGVMALHTALQDMGEQAPIRLATDVGALKSANLILGASNAPEPLIYPQLLGEGPGVICDVSVPADTHPSVLEHSPQFSVIQGGLVRLPHNPEFRISGIPLEKGICFACMGETLLMGLTGMGQHYSYGRITREQVQTILKLADLHGFTLGRARIESSY